MTYCGTSSLEECVSFMQNKLVKDNQISEYDEIYDFAFQNNLTNTNEVIPNLHKKVEMIIYCQYFRYLLYPNMCKFKELFEKRMKWLLKFFSITEYTISSFISICGKLINLFSSESKSQPTDESTVFFRIKPNSSRVFYPYVLIGNLNILSFDSLSELLFWDSRYSKIPLEFKLYNEEIFSRMFSPVDLLYSDMHNLDLFQQANAICNLQDVSDRINSYPKNSVKRKLMNVFAVTNFFKNLIPTVDFDTDELIGPDLFSDFKTNFMKIPTMYNPIKFQEVVEYLKDKEFYTNLVGDITQRYKDKVSRFTNKMDYWEDEEFVSIKKELRDKNVEIFEVLCQEFNLNCVV